MRSGIFFGFIPFFLLDFVRLCRWKFASSCSCRRLWRQSPRHAIVTHARHRSGRLHPFACRSYGGRTDRSHHRKELRHAIGSGGATRNGLHECAAGDASRTRHFETRRQRGRCGHCRERDARFDGAGLEWHRRRFVRHRLQRERKQTLRDQRQRPFAARLELRANESGAGEVEARDHSAARHVADQRAGLRGCVGRAAQEIRQTQTRR